MASNVRSGCLPVCRRILLAALLILSSTAALADDARGSSEQETIFDATVDLIYAPSIPDRAQRALELDRLGVDVIRLYVPWRTYAPRPGLSQPPVGFHPANPREYPQAPFDGLDDTINQVRARGMGVLLTPTGPFPDWASASGASEISDPLPARYRQFVRALGRRYSGDFEIRGAPLARVNRWAIWNEPNLDVFLQPQFRDGKPYSALLYRRLYAAATEALEASGHGRDTILIGETATTGGRASIDPIPFMRGVLCLNRGFRLRPGCRPIAADGWSHHPYAYANPPQQVPTNPGMISMRTIGRLTAALGRASDAGATTERLDVFITEFGILSAPKDIGVGLVAQAAYMAIGEYLAWKEPRVRSYAQYLMRDDPILAPLSFTTGLRTEYGDPKPSLRSFPMTLLVRRTAPHRVEIWGHVRPARKSESVNISFADDRGPTRFLRRVRTDSSGYFEFGSRFRPGRRWSQIQIFPVAAGSGARPLSHTGWAEDPLRSVDRVRNSFPLSTFL